jgi:Mce-associated membrane protein
VATPATVPADLLEDAPAEPEAPPRAEDTATATPATDDDVATSERAEETTALPAADATTSTVSTEPSTETATQESTEDTTAEAEPVAEGVAATTVTTPRPKGRRTTRMTPRADAPTTVRPGRRDDDTAASPTRTARPTRVRGRKPEADGAPRRFEGQRAALTRFGGSKALPITLVAVIVVCLVLAGLAFWQGRQAWTSGPVSNQAVVDVGGTAELVGQSRESIEKIFSYDFTRLDDSVEAARTMSTGQFTDRYLSVFDQTIRTPAQQQQLRQTATVQNIGVVSMRDDRATVMALTQFSAQRTTTGQSTNAPGLLRLEMERVDGRWKLAELTPLTANR